MQSRTRGAQQKSDEVLLTWDESTAVRAVGRRTGREHCSGVIWLTDRPDGRSADAVRRALRGCRALWTLSSAQVEPLQRMMGPSGPSVRAVRFGVDHHFFSTHPYPDRPLVVSVGGDRDRDPRTLFAALEAVHRARPEVEIVVQSKAGLPVPDGVSVVPHLSHVELRDLYRRMSVMVIATGHNLHVSGMTVSLEARAVGRPVVITGSPGMEDYVSVDDSMVVGTGDASALADGVVTLLDDVPLAESMGTAGRHNVVARHTEAAMCHELLDVVRG
ncbi:glycosyl transferase family 1 [Terracoccus luteus]|uniref:D-inositol 3-phosphate glycosyltransferase n=1 Tax=Terracoccus luteus TaxID=53356 RepID=A0A495XZ83_9MICO|nr:glycosyl transferase family 1 [Terracoccus luteus]